MNFFNKVLNKFFNIPNNDQVNELFNSTSEDNKFINSESTAFNTNKIENVSEVNNFKQTPNTYAHLIDQNIPEVLFLKKLLTEKKKTFV